MVAILTALNVSDLLKMTLNGFGVDQNGRELQILASAENFAMRKHNLLQAMLAVNDMFYMAAPTVANIFYEDVEAWLDQHDIRHTPKVKFTGQTGYDHLFDFVIPKSRKQSERLIQTVNRHESFNRSECCTRVDRHKGGPHAGVACVRIAE